MTEEPTIKISQEEYRALTSIAITAEQYLRSGSLELAEELRDAVLITKAFADHEEVNQVKVVLSEPLHQWLLDEMALIADQSGMYDSERAKDVLTALQASSH